MPRKDEDLAKLLADGWAPDDLVWVAPGSGVDIELTYLKGQNEAQEMRKALDKAQDGQWLIRLSAVERRIRAMPGCENFSIIDAMTAPLPPFAAKAYGSRGPRI